MWIMIEYEIEKKRAFILKKF